MILNQKFQNRILRRLVRISIDIGNIRDALDALQDDPGCQLAELENQFKLISSECALAISTLDQYAQLLKKGES
jgi:hypothetical protein